MEIYLENFKQSIEAPEKFWLTQADGIHWFKKPETAARFMKNGTAKWFPDGTLNMSYLCLDRHVENGKGDGIALIYDSPVTQTIKRYTYNNLLESVSKMSGALQDLGFSKGDRVVIYMPMVPEAVISMLACARIGLIHSVVFGGFAPRELAIRIEDLSAKAIITADYGIEIDRVIPYHPIVAEAIRESGADPLVISFNRKEKDVPRNDNFKDFNQLLSSSKPVPCLEIEADHPLYVLYTSGTTGKPKGIVRDTGGHAVALKYSIEKVYGVKPGDTFWAASDIGWVVGHSYIVYAPMLLGATTILFEGKPVKTPDAGTFWRVIGQHKVNVFFTAPTAIRAIRKEDPDREFYTPKSTESLRTLFLAGERCDASTLEYAQQLLQKPVIDHWWQTESGWPMIANMQGLQPLPVKTGSSSLPVCGYNIRILKEDGTEATPNEQGLVTIKLPLPPGFMQNLWNSPERFEQGYLKQFPGYYFTGDGGYKDEDGYVFITGRIDDVINVAGHRLSTAEMEELTASLSCTAECAVIGAADELKGEIPVAFVVLKSNENRSETELRNLIITHIRKEIGAVASLKTVYFVPRLPKTRSGKILRNLLRNLINKEAYAIPGTIEDESVIKEIKSLLEA